MEKKLPSLNILRLCQGSQLPAKLLLVRWPLNLMYYISCLFLCLSQQEKLEFLFLMVNIYTECFLCLRVGKRGKLSSMSPSFLINDQIAYSSIFKMGIPLRHKCLSPPNPDER